MTVWCVEGTIAPAQDNAVVIVVCSQQVGPLGITNGDTENTTAIAMLTPLHLSTAERIGAAGLLIAAASGIGGGLASVISPAKLQNASASIDRIGEEAQVIRTTFVIALVITAVCGVMTLLWAF